MFSDIAANMSHMPPNPGRSARDVPHVAEDIGRLYEDLTPVLLGTLVRKFGVPHEDAETLLHDVFVAYLTIGVTVSDPRTWLIAAACNSAKAWHRARARYATANTIEAEPLDHEAESMRDALFVRDALTELPERAREAVRLRFVEGLQYAEVATRMGTSVKYAEKLVSKAMAKLRRQYREKMR